MNNEAYGSSSLLSSDFDLFTILHDVFVNIWMIIIAALIGAMAYVQVMSITYVPEYTTTATFVVVSKTDSSLYSNTNAANDAALTFQKILESSVMEKIIKENLNMDEVDADISAQVTGETNLMTLTVNAKTSKDAIDIIQTILDHYDEVSFYTLGNAVIQIIQEPTVPYAPFNTLDSRQNAKMGALIGAAAMLLILIIISYMHDTVKQEKEIEKKLDARSLGAVAYEWKYRTLREMLKRDKKAALVDDPMSGFRFAESTKKLATKVQYQMSKNKRKVLVVSSVAENEGKSTIAANLAITLAKQGKRVVLIDGDIRKPSQQLIFGLNTETYTSLSDFLAGAGNLNDIIIPSGRENLLFIGGKDAVPSSTELLGSNRTGKLIEACKNAADYVIIDTPPAGLIGDAQIFGEHADAVLLVTRQNYILAEDINDVLDDFRDNHCKILGVVLNGVQGFSTIAESPVGGSKKYGYGYGYGRYNRYGKSKSSNDGTGK